MENWFGITLDAGADNVSKICLGDETDGTSSTQSCGYNGNGNNLIGTIPTSIGDFPELTQLILSKNTGITGSIPTEVGSLDKVIYLYLNNTGLSGAIPAGLGDMALLSILRLHNM